MGIETFIESMERRFADQIAATSALDPSAGEFETFPSQLHLNLAEALRASGIHNLYSHQSEAFEAIEKGEDTVLVSRTASGKNTLIFVANPECLSQCGCSLWCNVTLSYEGSVT